MGSSIAELRRNVFNAHLHNALKDKFVTGTLMGPVLDKLFELEATSVFTQIVEEALNREMTTKLKSQTFEINKMHVKRNNSSHKNKSSNEKPFVSSSSACFDCGKPNHNFKTCRNI